MTSAPVGLGEVDWLLDHGTGPNGRQAHAPAAPEGFLGIAGASLPVIELADEDLEAIRRVCAGMHPSELVLALAEACGVPAATMAAALHARFHGSSERS